MAEKENRDRYLVRLYAGEWQVWDCAKLQEHSLHVKEDEAKKVAKKLNGR